MLRRGVDGVTGDVVNTDGWLESISGGVDVFGLGKRFSSGPLKGVARGADCARQAIANRCSCWRRSIRDVAAKVAKTRVSATVGDWAVAFVVAEMWRVRQLQGAARIHWCLFQGRR